MAFFVPIIENWASYRDSYVAGRRTYRHYKAAFLIFRAAYLSPKYVDISIIPIVMPTYPIELPISAIGILIALWGCVSS